MAQYRYVVLDRAVLMDILELERPDEIAACAAGLQLLGLYRRCKIEIWTEGHRIDVLPHPPLAEMN